MNLPDRDALLYFQTATGCFEEAEELHQAGDLLAARDSIKAGIRTIGLALQVVTTAKGRGILEESLDFWAGTLADIESELAADQVIHNPALLAEAAENGRQLALWGE